MKHIAFSDFDWPWSRPYPFSQWARVGDLILLSGQVAFDPDGDVVGVNDIAAQTKQIFSNIGTLLDDAGVGFVDIVHMRSYFVASMADRVEMARFFDVRRSFLLDHKPVSTGVQVAGLIHPALLVEIEVTAAAPRR